MIFPQINRAYCTRSEEGQIVHKTIHIAKKWQKKVNWFAVYNTYIEIKKQMLLTTLKGSAAATNLFSKVPEKIPAIFLIKNYT